MATTATHPSFGQALRFWLKLGFISFGGPTGQIAIMHQELVERRRWISEQRFLHALDYCMLLPGPEAMQLATYVGWLLHKVPGGLVAGSFFVLPSIFVLLALSYVYVTFGSIPAIAALFYGLKAAVLAIVANATIRIGARALRRPLLYGLAAAAFVALFFLHVPFPAVIVAAAAAGLTAARFWPQALTTSPAAGEADAVISDSRALPPHTQPSRARILAILVVFAVLWLIPLIGLAAWRGTQNVLFQEAVFFSKAAMVTFGGAYAVLPYVAQEAVETHGWLTRPQMIDGLGLAETTPGPLIMVLQFVGFLAGWHHAADLGPLGAILGALTATYFTFMPCFLWIFVGAPYVETVRGNRSVAAALSAVTAAVVGVILNLAVWFGLQVLLPTGEALDGFALALTAAEFVALQRLRWDVLAVVGSAAGAGLLYRTFA